MKRLLSIVLTLCMTLSLFPAPVFAVDEEAATKQVIGLPIIAEGEEAPAPQGACGSPTLMDYIAPMEGCAYAFEGSEYMHFSGETKILDGTTGGPVTTKPESNGLLQMVNSEGTVVASSEAISYYYSKYVEGSYSTIDYYYVSYANFRNDSTQDLSLLPDGTYTLQLYAGNTVYPCTGNMIIVDDSNLLIDEAYLSNFYPGEETYEVHMELYGFETEQELDAITLTLTDAEGNVVATESGNYREFDVYDYYGVMRWYLYAQLTLAEGQSISEDVEYTLQIGYTGEKDLYDAVGAATREAYNPSLEIAGFTVLDAQSSLVQISFDYWDSETEYAVTVRDENSSGLIVGTYEGKIPETGTVELNLTKGGSTTPMTAFGNQLYIYVAYDTYSNRSQYVDNPYYNLSDGGYDFWLYPRAIDSEAKTWNFRLVGDTTLYQRGGDVVVLKNNDGEEVARCEDLTEVSYNEYQFEVTGTFIFNESLSTGYLDVYFNGVQGDTVYVTDEMYITYSVPFCDWDSATQIDEYYLNLGVFPVTIGVLNSGGKGTISIVDAEGDEVCSSGTITGVEGEYQDFLYYSHMFTAEDFAALTQYATCTMVYTDSNGQTSEYDLGYYDAEVTVLDLTSGSRQYYIEGYNSEVGDTTIRMEFRMGNGLRNTVESDLDVVKELTMTNTDTAESFTVTGYTNGRWENDYYYYVVDLNISAPLTAGYYEVYYGATRVYTFSIREPEEYAGPYVNGSFSIKDGMIHGYALPSDGVYTGKLYSGYTCLTEDPIPLTWEDADNDYYDYLNYPVETLLALNLAEGEYEFRVWMGDTIIGNATLEVLDSSLPVVELHDAYDSRRSKIITRGMYYFTVANGGLYTQLRAAESLEALQSTLYYPVGDRMTYRLSDGYGEKTVYAQLQTADGTQQTDVLTFKLWRMAEGDLIDLTVPEDIQGVYGGAVIEFQVGAECPYAQPWMEYETADGNIGKVALAYDGFTQLKSLYPTAFGGMESGHPIGGTGESGTQSWTYTVEGAESIRVTFSPATNLAYGNTLYIYAGKDTNADLYDSFSYYYTDDVAGKSFVIPGDSITVSIYSSSYSDPCYGFVITEIEDATAVSEDEESAGGSTYVYTSGLLTVEDYYANGTYLRDCETVRFYLVDENKQVVSETVERMLIFGNPDTVILPQFRDYNYSTVYFTTNDVKLYGYATPNSTVTITMNDEEVATTAANTYGYFSVMLEDLEEGYHNFSASDDSGVTAATTESFYVDTVVPVVESISFTFDENNAATIRWVCNDSDIEKFQILKNNVMQDSWVENTASTYSVTAAQDDGNLFTIRAIDYAGNVGELTVSTADQVPPTAPATLTASNVTTSTATLTWSAGTDNIGVMGYVIYQDGVELVRTEEPDSLSYTVTGLVSGETYSFTVKTRDKAGNTSVSSPAAEVTTVLLTVTPELESTYVVDEYPSKNIPVQYTVSANVEGYNVSLREAWMEFRPTGSADSVDWTENKLNASGSGYWNISGDDDDGYLPKGSYDLYIYVTDNTGTTVASVPVTVVVLTVDTKPPTVPGAPEAISHTTTSIQFEWTESTDNVGVDHYEVWRDGVKITETKTLTYNDTALEMGEHTYTIKAVDARGNVSESSAAAVLSTMTLEFDSVIDFEDAYVLEEQLNKQIAVWAKFKPDEGYDPEISMAVEYKAADAEEWTAADLTVSATDANYFSGNWDVSGDELGYLPEGSYIVRFSVTDGSATAYSAQQTVMLNGETEAPVVGTLTPSSGTFGGKNEIAIEAEATDNAGVTNITLSYAPDGSDQFTELCTVETTYSAAYAWDASQLESGVYVIKAEAEDARGNVGEKTVSITVDNTPPVEPSGLTARSTSRYIHVTWNTNYIMSDDFDVFCLYRATEADGEYTLVSDRKSVGYYDDGKTAKEGVTYYYYVTARDVYGNESAAGQTVSATFVNDNESPAIGDMLPREGKSLRKSETLKVTAMDNYRLAKAIFSYRLAGSETWIEIGTDTVDGITNNTVFQLDWAIPTDITKGTYEVKAEVYDASINDVEEGSGYSANAPAAMLRSVILNPYHEPVKPAVTATAEYKKAVLDWTYSGDLETLSSFTVYQTNSVGGERTYAASVVKGETGSATVKIPATGEQYFVVVATDTYGATAESAVIAVTSAPKETEAPVAVMQPETLTAAAGVPFSFSAVNSTDNDEIASYAWSFGDGAAATGSTCEHTYAQAGTYTVKLTVTDACGNVGTAEGTMTVYDVTGENATHALMTVSVVNAYVEGTPAIEGADVKIYIQDENTTFETSAVADVDGKITAVVPIGEVTVAATAEGYMATSRSATVVADETGAFAYTVGMTPMNVSLVDGSLTVKEMTYDEIIAAGIDVTAPDNNHVWKFAATLEFVAAPAFPFDLPALPIEGYFNGAGTFLGGTGWGWNFLGGFGGGGGTGWGMNIGIFPISENFVLVIYGEAHWLKEMYNVELIVINNSYVDDITDCEATLDLPDGLSLAAMTGRAQSNTIDLGTIPHKDIQNEGANTTKANWYVRGDKEGEYNLTATVTGNNPTPFVKTFTTDKPVKVYAGSALKLTITAEDIAYREEEYHVQFKLENVSHKDLYNLSFGITGADQFRVTQLGDTEYQQELTHEDFGSGMTKKVPVLHPDGSITIDFYTTVWFNSLLELADLGPMDVGYYLTNVFVTTLEGSTTTIPYEVQIVHSSHGTFFEWLADQVKDGVEEEIIDILEDEFLGEVPLISTGKKIYEFAHTGEADSRCEIAVDNGYMTTSNNVINLMGEEEGAIAIYTDGEYEISEDGKTMILTGDGKIYVEGRKPGTATMTVTTTYNNGERTNVHTLTYQVRKGTGTADGLILQAPIAGLENGVAAVPLEGKTLEITFPYVLKDIAGGYLMEADNAKWTISGDDTTGLSIENGVLTVKSSAKAGEYTVTLTVGDKSASQTFTLTREPSVAQRVEISSGDGAVGESYILTKGLVDGDVFTLNGRVIDQYGVAMESPVTWTVTDNTSDAAFNNGIITLGSTSGTMTVSVAVDSDPAMTDTVAITVINASDLKVGAPVISDTDCTVSVSNDSQVTITLQGMVAAYDANGKMIACEMQLITLTAGGETQLPLTYEAKAGVATVKVFLLNTETFQPLKEALVSNAQ